MDVLVIGGSRFMGPHMISKLLRNNHMVTVFNRGKIKSEYKDEITFIQGDRNDGLEIAKHFDVVIDTCAYNGFHTKKAIKELDFDFFVHIGTAASYKKPEIFPIEETAPLGDWLLWGEYNKGKVECEQALRDSGINFATIRPVYILGQNNCCDRERFIYSKIKKAEPILIPGNGQSINQFVFVNDVAEAIVVLAEKRISGAFNCAGDEFITLKGLVEEMSKLVDKKPIIKFNPSTDGDKFDVNEFPFANENFFCSNKKIKKLGVEFTPLLTGLKNDYGEYYKKII